MSHMQGAGDVGRWNQYAITVASVAGFEKFCLFPVLVKALLNGLRIEVIVMVTLIMLDGNGGY